MKKLYLGFFYLMLNASVNAQTTLQLNPVKDNTIYQDFDNSNGKGENFFSGNTNQGVGHARRGLLKFDLSSIPAGAVVSAASLTLYCNKTAGAGAKNFTLFKLLADWGEGTSDAGSSNDGGGTTPTADDATWTCSFADGGGGCTTAWTTAGGVYSSTPTATTSVNGASASYSWSGTQLRTDIADWIANPSNNFGWVLVGDEAASVSAKRFGARENTTASQRPSLSITYTVPSLCPGINTWTGAISSAWETPGNWSCGSIPTATTTVRINSGTVVVNSNAFCKTITINPSVSFTVNTGFNFTVVQ